MKWIISELGDSSFSSSSDYNRNHSAKLCRLNNSQGKANWSAKTNDKNQWIQVDLGSVFTIKAVAVQGRFNMDQWVTKLNIGLSTDLKNWTEFKDVKGASDRNTVNIFNLPKETKAKHVRFLPQEWNNHISMRVDIAITENEIKSNDSNEVKTKQKPITDLKNSFDKTSILREEITLLENIFNILIEINKEMTYHKFLDNDKLSGDFVLTDYCFELMGISGNYNGLTNNLIQYKNILEKLSKVDNASAKKKFSELDNKLDNYDMDFREWLKKAEDNRKDKRKTSDSLKKFQKIVNRFTNIFEEYSYSGWTP